MNMSANPTMAWASVSSPLSQPVSSRFVTQGERYFNAEVNGQNAKFYAACQTSMEQLQPGDSFVAEWKNGKWKIASTQPPELLATLASRAPAQPPPSQFPPKPGETPPATLGTTTVKPATAPTAPDIIAIVGIFAEIRAALPAADEETIRALTETIFINRGKR